MLVSYGNPKRTRGKNSSEFPRGHFGLRFFEPFPKSDDVQLGTVDE
jgi:hypothetical protein